MRKKLLIATITTLGVSITTTTCGTSKSECYDDGYDDCLSGNDDLPDYSDRCKEAYNEGYADAGCTDDDTSDTGWYDTGVE